MNIKQIKTFDQIEDFLVSVGSMDLSVVSKDEAYRCIAQMLGQFHYASLSRSRKALLQRFLMRVAGMLGKLLIEFTKSRSRQSNDNALVESKNGSVIQKKLGYQHIPQRFAAIVNQFNEQHLVPYINFHRPCFFAVTETDAKGKQHKKYPYEGMMTPYEKLKSIDNAAQYLKPGMSFLRLDAIAYRVSDNDAAAQLQAARKQLFETISGDQRALG